jgi:hypothetical protein
LRQFFAWILTAGRTRDGGLANLDGQRDEHPGRSLVDEFPNPRNRDETAAWGTI